MDIDRVVDRITQEVLNRISESDKIGGSKNIGSNIEYAMFSPLAKVEDIRHVCQKAKTENLACVGVPQWFVVFAKSLLEDTDIKVCTPLSLPGGSAATPAKYAEANEAVKNGADEIAIPINMNLLRAGKLEELKNDFSEAMLPASKKAKVKAVVEFDQISNDDIKNAIAIVKACRADYFVISNILSGAQAKTQDVEKVRALCGDMKIKVLGGVKNEQDAKEIISAGADIVTLTSV
jgi:deoxyribose-phosphate aldolase